MFDHTVFFKPTWNISPHSDSLADHLSEPLTASQLEGWYTLKNSKKTAANSLLIPVLTALDKGSPQSHSEKSPVTVKGTECKPVSARIQRVSRGRGPSCVCHPLRMREHCGREGRKRVRARRWGEGLQNAIL